MAQIDQSFLLIWMQLECLNDISKLLFLLSDPQRATVLPLFLIFLGACDRGVTFRSVCLFTILGCLKRCWWSWNHTKIMVQCNLQVNLCRAKATGEVYAMKKLKKSEMLSRGQVLFGVACSYCL